MGDNTDYEKVAILNTVYNNTLQASHISKLDTIASPLIKTQLLPHQTVMVHGLHNYRDKMTRGFLVGNQAINGKIGIIGDPSGTGKTLSILSYLATHSNTVSKITMELTPNSTKYFFSHDIHEVSANLSTNLIIVPHSIFTQWRNEIEQHTSLEFVPIETKRIVKGTELAQQMIKSKFVLTTNKCYKFVQAYANHHKIHWNNVFIDEASSIYLHSSDPPLRFQFLWLITNNWIPLLFKNPSITKSNLLFLRDRIQLHPELEHWLLDNITMHYQGELLSSSFLKDYLSFFHTNRGHIVLRNSAEYIQSSIDLPQYTQQMIHCKPNITLQSLTSFYLAKNMKLFIRSEKIPHLFQSLGIACKGIADYLPFQLTIKHKLIQQKMQDNECVICLDNCEYPTIVNCCYNIYCGKCLLKNTLITYKCPTCREALDTTSMCCLTPLTEETTILAKNKMEACIDIIKKNIVANKDAKIIIYSAFDNIYYQMFEQMDNAGLKAERLETNIFSLLKTIKNFKEGNTNILFISNVNSMRGLSLPSTSHLIFYHELPAFELKEVLIHSAQRIGRKKPLSVIHLNSEIQV